MLEIPGGFVFHSVPVNTENGMKYVTVAFGICDDLKATATDEASLKLGDKTLAARGISGLDFGDDESGRTELGKIFAFLRVALIRERDFNPQ